MAQGVPHTHAARSSLSLSKLSAWAFEITNDREFAENILSANTARHAFDFILNQRPEVISRVGKLMIKAAKIFAAKDVHIQSIIFDYSGNLIFDSKSNNKLYSI